MADEEIKVVITGTATGAKEAMSEASGAVKSGTDSMKDSLEDLNQSGKSSFDGVGESLDDLRSMFQTAFEFTGLAAAYEGISKLGEMIEQLGARAVQMRTMSEVLGLSTDQFQALSVAADESGVSIETAARAVERLRLLLIEARDGSGDAVAKLHQLGITNEQIADSIFGVDEMLGVLRQRLDDVSTHQETLNALLKELGIRGSLATEIINEYDGSQQGVKKTMEEVNGLSAKQIDQLKQLHSWWERLKTQADNIKSGMLAGAFEQAGSGHPTDQADSFLDQQAAANDSAGGGGASAQSAQSAAAAAAQGVTQSLQTVGSAIQKVTLQEVEDAKTAIDTYKAGSEARLAALQEYATLASQYYGSGTDKAKAADAALLAAQRQTNDARKAVIIELDEFDREEAAKLYNDKLRFQTQLDQAHARSAAEEERQMQELTDFAIEEVTKTRNEKAKAIEEMMALDKRLEQSWVQMADRISESFSSALTGLITRTTSWASVAQSLETQMLQNTIRNVTQSVARNIAGEAAKQEAAKKTAVVQGEAAADAAQETVGQSAWAAIKKIGNDAESAASGAFQAVVGIPYVGPFLAPIAAATAFAAVIAFEGGIASAAGGYDIPSNLSPMTQLHPEEMVLPAHLANAVRQMAAGGGGGRSGPDVHLHINAMDASSFQSWARSGGAEMMTQALAKHHHVVQPRR